MPDTSPSVVLAPNPVPFCPFSTTSWYRLRASLYHDYRKWYHLPLFALQKILRLRPTGTARDAQDRGAARQRTGHRPAPGAIAE